MIPTDIDVRWKAFWGIVLVLAATAAAYAGANYVEFFGKAPGLVLAGGVIIFVAYLPSLWVIRRLDHRPYSWAIYAAVVGFMVAISPIISEVTWDVINSGVRYWQIVGFTEEAGKLLPVVLCLLLFPGMVQNRRDGVVIGGLAGLGFAIIEFAVGFALDNFPERGWSDLTVSLPARWALGTEMHILWAATTGGAVGYWAEEPRSRKRLAIMIGIIALVIVTHGAQDMMGKYIGPLSIGVVGGGALAAGIPESAFYEGGPLFIAMMISGAVINTILINFLVLPVLWRLIRSGARRTEAPSS